MAFRCSAEECDETVFARDRCHSHYRLLREEEAAGDPEWPTCDLRYCVNKTRCRTSLHCSRHEQRLRITGTLDTTRHTLLQYDEATKTAFCEKCLRVVPTVKRAVKPSVSTSRRVRAPGVVCSFSDQDTALRTAYGLTLKEYDSLVAASGGRCAICGEEPFTRHGRKTLHVDHDHDTGQVRGLLCQPCNLAIGFLRDRPELARNVADYLERKPIAG